MRYTLSLAVALAAALALTPSPVRGEGGVRGTPPPDAQDIVLLAQGRPYLIRLAVTVDGKPYSARFDAYLKRWFTYLDRNGDGTLDRAEASHAPPLTIFDPQVQVLNFGRGGPTTPAPWRELDADGDGRVTPDEFVTYYRRAAFKSLQLADGNQNGTSRASDMIFKALDVDGDGKLSTAELARAEEALRRFDLNDDELITAQELVGNTVNPVQVFQPIAPPQVSASTGPVLLIPSDAVGRYRAAKTVLAHYDKKADGVLTREAIRLPGGLFDKLDKDRDGVLNAAELSAWLTMPPDAVVVVRLGKIGSDQAPVEALVGDPDRPAVAVEKTAPGVLRLSVGNLRVRLKEGSANAGNPLGARLRQFYLQNFKAADKDNKGFLNADDLKDRQAQAIFGSLFAAADHDGDGKLTEMELIEYLNLVDDAPACLTGMTVTESGTGLFEMLDADGDGRLSIRELRNAAKRLGTLDREGKGYIARGDIPSQVQIALTPGPVGGNGLNQGIQVVRRPGVIPDGRRPAVAPRGPLWFRKMDLNGDGDVSPREWLGTPEQFKLIDEDGDGLISVEEADRYERRRQREAEKR